jgi:hypothetical protein
MWHIGSQHQPAATGIRHRLPRHLHKRFKHHRRIISAKRTDRVVIRVRVPRQISHPPYQTVCGKSKFDRLLIRIRESNESVR